MTGKKTEAIGASVISIDRKAQYILKAQQKNWNLIIFLYWILELEWSPLDLQNFLTNQTETSENQLENHSLSRRKTKPQFTSSLINPIFQIFVVSSFGFG